jgi:arabinose-5-phosphate isomerase
MRRDWLSLARQVLDIEIQGIQEVRENLGEEFVHALETLASCPGRVVVTGVGKSGLVGRKIAATLSSTGTPAYFLHPVEGIHGDLGLIREGDVVLALSNSGETDELNTILPTLESLGTKIISLTGNTHSTMAKLSHITISTHVPQEACTLGLAPTASTTAALAVGDALAVGLIEWKSFGKDDFRKNHPGGDLGRRLSLTIDALMHTEGLPIVQSGMSLQKAFDILDQGGMGTVIVLDSKTTLLGILTDGDVRRLVCHRQFSLQDPVDDYMTRNPRYVSLGQRCAQVLDAMEQSSITVMPVVDEEVRIKGVIHLHDLLGKGRLLFNGQS